ncbi:MAG: response regulator [Deltaproteobacteria bacterium]|nr:response regulator [bacterium]MCB9489618.1 response regulator [Deltaproteobacteria bacterium]
MPGEATGKCILIVDDDERLRDQLARALGRRGLSTLKAANFDEAVEIARTNAVELATVDLRMPGRPGLELIPELLAIRPELQIVVLTGYGSIATAIEAIRLGALNYVQKPADADDVLAAFEKGNAPPLAPAESDYVAPSLARAEWEHIQRVLADCGGNISEAARRLGVHRRTLQRKLGQFPPKA